MATNSELSQALRGNTNAAKNHVKKLGAAASSAASGASKSISAAAGAAQKSKANQAAISVRDKVVGAVKSAYNTRKTASMNPRTRK